MPKITWLIKRDADDTWEISFSEPEYYYRCKKIVYFEIEDNE